MIVTNLLTNMIVLGLNGEIPTNTPAFQAYVRSAMFSNAQSVASQWRLDPELIVTNRITQFRAGPYPERYSAAMEFSGRYSFLADEFGSFQFSDQAYSQRSVFVFTNGEWEVKWGQQHRADFEQHTAEQHRLRIAALEGDEKRNQAIAERWAAATNLLTLRKARHLAELAWRSFGVPPKWAGAKIKWHVEAKQTIWEEASVTVFLPADAVATRATKHGPKDTIRGLPEAAGKVLSVVGPLSDGGWCVTYARKHPQKLALPYYEFRWEDAPGSGLSTCVVEVSGMTGTIAYFEGSRPGAEAHTPTNYFQLLGLPANVVFVRPRATVPRTYETVP